MLKKLFSIRDSKAEVYTAPMAFPTHGEAERTFRDIVADPKTTISRHPEDFDLYHLGSFDDDTGKIESLPTPQHMLKAVNAIQPNLGSITQ